MNTATWVAVVLGIYGCLLTVILVLAWLGWQRFQKQHIMMETLGDTMIGHTQDIEALLAKLTQQEKSKTILPVRETTSLQPRPVLDK